MGEKGNAGYQYDAEKMRSFLYEVINKSCSSSCINRLINQFELWQSQNKMGLFYSTFTAVARFADKKIPVISQKEEESFSQIRKGFSIRHWPPERLIRCWWLLQLPAEDRNKYFQPVEALFLSADMNELVALYSALPLLAYPGSFVQRTKEGIRTNISPVLEAIALHNPYPAEYLDEEAWNQMILKCFFTEKPVEQIIGLDERANPHLAVMLCDYARERWAAGRPVNPQLWRLVGKFINESNFPLIEKLSLQKTISEQQAAALSCADSNFSPAKELLKQHEKFRNEIKLGKLTWNTIILLNN
jgi:hypothetical protein